MAVPSAILSQTLQSLTNIKFAEINKQRQKHASFQDAIFRQADSTQSRHDRVELLIDAVDGVSNIKLDRQAHHPTKDMRRLLEQSKYDASVPETLIGGFEDALRHAIAAKGQTFDFAHLYARLLQEWIRSSPTSAPSEPQVREADDEYQVVERNRLQQLREKFSDVVFNPVNTDEAGIDRYLRAFFRGVDGAKTLDYLRDRTRSRGDFLFRMTAPFDVHAIRSCIHGLCKQELLKDEKKTTLLEFEKNETVLNELADVLNLRYADLKNWTWDAPDGLAVEPRRQLNGKWRVMADEDILQAIFLQYLGVQWSMHFKSVFEGLVCDPAHNPGVWTSGPAVPSEHVDRLEYFSGQDRAADSMRDEKNSRFKAMFLANLPDRLEDDSAPYDDDEHDDGDAMFKSGEKKGRPSSSLKDLIHRQLAADVLVCKQISGHAVALQGDLQWYLPALPHSTVLAVLRFYGVPEPWLDFFVKYLRAPLKMSASEEVRTRECGIPIASSMSRLLGEVVLFALDLAVNSQSDLLLYRMHDDFWMAGEPEQVARGWKAIKECVSVMGLELNRSKCGSAYLVSSRERDAEIERALPDGPVEMGFLRLDRDTGRWQIHRESVTAHINQLRTQLAACNSVLSWISTWNSCIGRFFGRSFGRPAVVFGRAHLDDILAEHVRIQQELFGGTTVNEHIRGMIARRFDKQVPDAFLFMPQSLGGLGVKNPFINLFLLRNSIQRSPEEMMSDLWREECDNYEQAETKYAALSERDRRKRINSIWDADADDAAKPTPASPFPSFEEWTRHRETTGPELKKTYVVLMRVLSRRSLLHQGKTEVIVTDEERWIVHMYRKELKELFGGVRIVEPSLLPVGVLEMMNQRRGGWAMRL